LFSQNTKIIVLFTQKFVVKLPKIMDVGSGIRDPGSGKPIPGFRVKKARDPGSGSATLGKTETGYNFNCAMSFVGL
jgi:hypothetical protein